MSELKWNLQSHGEDLPPLPADFAARLLAKDPTLWPGDAGPWLGWVDIADRIEARFDEIDEFVADVKAAGFRQVVLCGMGGSSLAPYVLARIGGVQPGGLPLHVLDSTHPGAIAEVNGNGTKETLFIVASKSGSTAEPTAFDSYFFEQLGDPSAFVAITDPGSPFERSARERGFRKVFLNYPDIGGRFSALSLFGLVPAALLGQDFREMVRRARDVSDEAFQLGNAMGRFALRGIDKLTVLTDEHWLPFGLWLEQLVAESTGKQGKGILPIAGEAVGALDVYGADRFFVGINQDAPGAPSVRIDISDPLDLGREFMKWEIATATAGAHLEIDPFDQPNVQESKDVTKAILAELEETGKLEANPDSVRLREDLLRSFLSSIEPGDYISIQAYLHGTPEMDRVLARLQAALRDHYHVAVTCGYGPRFLHSTGQFHKGGPNTGYFIQLIDQPVLDFPIPNQTATWRQFVHAQALGDYRALRSKDRRAISIDLGGDPASALEKIFP